MSGAELFDRFVAHGVGVRDIAKMEPETIARQVGELRHDEPDDIPMSDDEIARAIMDYAREAGR